jgi:Flp pilus assembly protein TadD
VAAVQQLEGVYTQAAQMGSAEWAVASLWKIGLSYQHLVDSVSGSEELRAQAAPLKERADAAFKACLSRAVSLEVFTPAVLACRDRTEVAKSPLAPVAPGRPAPELENLRRKVETSADSASLEALGIGYLQVRSLPQAQLTLARATELQDTRASAHNALGLALLLQGEAMSARSAYGKALETDPTFDKARANLAGLRCRYGDQEGAKRELALVKDFSSLNGPDVDPEWKACR